MKPQKTHQVAAGWQRVIDENGTAQYLPAPVKTQQALPMLGDVLPPSEIAPANLVHAWQQPVEGMVEQTSATDRAKGVVLRSLPTFGLVALLSAAGAMIAYGVAGAVPSAAGAKGLCATCRNWMKPRLCPWPTSSGAGRGRPSSTFCSNGWPSASTPVSCHRPMTALPALIAGPRRGRRCSACRARSRP